MKIAILGLGQIGEYYLRDFLKFNCKIKVFKNSKFSSSLKKKKYIREKYNINIDCAKNFKTFFSVKFDTLLICSPNKRHYNHLKYGINKNKKIIIEKPIISLTNYSTIQKAEDRMKKIIESNPKIIYLLINEYYADIYKKIFNIKIMTKKKFIFNFHTQGNCNYKEIMDDLLPHFFSIFNKLHKYKQIKNIKYNINKNNNLIQFKADKCLCQINLKQKSKNKKFEFGFDNSIIRRLEGNLTKKNKILIQNLSNNKINKIENPLTLYVKKYTNKNKIDYKEERNKIIKNFYNCCKIYYA